MTTDGPSAADERRIADLFLAVFDNDRAAHDQAVAAVEASPGGWKAAFSTLAYHHAATMSLFLGEGKAREILQSASWDASIYAGGQ